MTAKDAIDDWYRADRANRFLNPNDKIAGLRVWLHRAGLEDADFARLEIHPHQRLLDWVGRLIVGVAVVSFLLRPDLVSGDSAFAAILVGITISLVASRRLSYNRRVARSIELSDAGWSKPKNQEAEQAGSSNGG